MSGGESDFINANFVDVSTHPEILYCDIMFILDYVVYSDSRVFVIIPVSYYDLS